MIPPLRAVPHASVDESRKCTAQGVEYQGPNADLM